jgi:hypothetical protein
MIYVTKQKKEELEAKRDEYLERSAYDETNIKNFAKASILTELLKEMVVIESSTDKRIAP